MYNKNCMIFTNHIELFNKKRFCFVQTSLCFRFYNYYFCLQSIYFPSHAGFPLGDSNSPRYVMVETHYDNPLEISGD